MSIASITNTITRLQKDLADLAIKLSQETKKEVSIYARINQIQRTINKNTSGSVLTSKLTEIERKQNEIANISNNKANIAKKEVEKKYSFTESKTRSS